MNTFVCALLLLSLLVSCSVQYQQCGDNVCQIGECCVEMDSDPINASRRKCAPLGSVDDNCNVEVSSRIMGTTLVRIKACPCKPDLVCKVQTTRTGNVLKIQSGKCITK